MNRKSKAITVLLADDHPIVRHGLKTLLETTRDFKVHGQAGDGAEALHLISDLQPDLVVLDLMMPKLNGLEAISEIRHRSPQTRILIFSMYTTTSFVVAALQKGATSYVPKGCGYKIILQALHDTAAGRSFLGPPLSKPEILAELKVVEKSHSELYEVLTDRQREVLRLVAQGYTSRQIAARFHLSTRTVEMHRTHIMHRLGLHSPGDLVRYAVRLGIVPMDEE